MSDNKTSTATLTPEDGTNTKCFAIRGKKISRMSLLRINISQRRLPPAGKDMEVWNLDLEQAFLIGVWLTVLGTIAIEGS